MGVGSFSEVFKEELEGCVEDFVAASSRRRNVKDRREKILGQVESR